MTAWRCREVEARLIDGVDGRLDSAENVRLHAHLESCAACRERAALWRGLTPALRALEPDPPAAMATRRMQVEIERQLTELASVAPPRRWRWVWAPSLLGLVGAAAIALLWFRHPAPPPGSAAEGFATIAHLTGALTDGTRALAPSMTVPAGRTLALATSAEAELAMARGTLVHVAGPAHIALGGTATAVTVRLDDGALTASVAHRLPGESFAVVTPDLRVEVRGTRFSVARGPDGSRVAVEEGRVLVQFADGRTRFVSAGESATSSEPREEPPAPTAVEPPAAEIETAPTPVHPPTCSTAMRACRETAGVVRSTMRGGDPTRALRLLSERARATFDLDQRCGGEEMGACEDELRYLRAEALNQGGRLDEAIAAYRAIDRRGAPPAMRQNALYAAAQIERRRGHDDRARLDYEHALDVAPRGALREEILIGAMETEQIAGNRARASALAHRYLGEFPNGIGAPTARRLAGGELRH